MDRIERYRLLEDFALRDAKNRPESEDWWVVQTLLAAGAWSRMTEGQRTVAAANGWCPITGPRS